MSRLFSNRYKLIRQIGEGGYGVVWLANDIINNTEVAIKIYKDSIPCDIVERADVVMIKIGNILGEKWTKYDICLPKCTPTNR